METFEFCHQGFFALSPFPSNSGKAPMNKQGSIERTVMKETRQDEEEGFPEIAAEVASKPICFLK